MVRKKGYVKTDRFGREIEDDDDVLRDGQRISVPMMLRDDLNDKAARVGFDDASRHQPGPVSTDQAGFERKARAYEDAKRELRDAWKTSNTNDREVASLHDTGDAVRDAYLDNIADLTSAWSRRR